MKHTIAVQLSYEVQNEEKDRANKAILYLDYIVKLLRKCNEHLDLIYTPFKDNPNITPADAYKARAGLRRYRDRVADNFNQLKRNAFRCFMLLRTFDSDTQTNKLTKAFVASIGDIEKQVNRFLDLFGELESKDFGATVVKSIENIKKEISQFEQTIEDRIKSHIQNNILAKSWTESISKELEEVIEDSIPFSRRLVEEREEKMSGGERGVDMVGIAGGSNINGTDGDGHV
jgi:hypothetical protein